MPSLRRRFLTATGLLLGLQAMSLGLAIASWRQVLGAAEREQALAEERVAVAALGEAVREQYVHEAHTFIEGGAGHLDHHEEIAADVDTKLATVRDLGRPGTDELADAIARSRAHFREAVVPLAQSGGLDRERASALHARTEALTDAVSDRIATLIAGIDADQFTERTRASVATARAWQATAALTVGGCLLSLLVARSLARAVLGPIDAVRAAASAFGRGETTARAPEAADQELAEVAHAFNGMVENVVRAEERRVRTERLAALGELSAAVAHELMNPLAVILGHPDLRGAELAPVRAEAEHARRVVQGLLGFARPGEEPAGPVDVTRAVRDAVDRITPTADARDVDVVLVGDAPLRATASPSGVRQVLDNLLRNAIEAAPPGSKVEVEVAADATVRVSDRGPGIPPRVRARLYEPFATGRAGGTGLGLAVCQRIVRAQGGTLAHLDRDGGGTIATWTLGGVDA